MAGKKKAQKAGKPSKPDRRKKVTTPRTRRPARAPFIDMVVPPDPFVCCAPSDWTKDVYVWDLDRTYLRTEFESLRDLIRTAMQKAKDKIAYPGAAALMRALRQGPQDSPQKAPGGASLRPIYFISASPPQIRKVIQEKFTLDGVEIDGIYFKDNIRNVRPGRLRRLKEQVGYKLLALIDLRSRLPAGATFTCFGDDVEMDVLIYSLFSEICDRWIRGRALVEFLLKQGVFPDEAVRIAWKARKLPPPPGGSGGARSRGRSRPVDRIFIHLHRDQDPRYYRRFGSRVVATRNYFQTALACFAEGKISLEGLADVGDEMLASRQVNSYDLAGSVLDLLERDVMPEAAVGRFAPFLIERKILPPGFP